MIKRPIYGQSSRSTNSKVISSKSSHRQSNIQVSVNKNVYTLTKLSSQYPNDNKTQDFLYYSDSDDDEGKLVSWTQHLMGGPISGNIQRMFP